MEVKDFILECAIFKHCSLKKKCFGVKIKKKKKKHK